MKGIDPKAREMAKGAARRSGMTLGEWLNQMIVEGERPEPPPFDRGPADLAPFDELRRSRHAAPSLEPRPLEALAARLEAAEHRSTLAISGIDQSVMGLLSRIEGIERDQFAAAARFDGALDELRADVAGTRRRMERLEVQPAAGDVGLLANLADRLHEAEARTSAAVRSLEASFAGLDARLSEVENEGVAVERRFARLAEELSERVEASRAEMAAGLTAGSGGRLDRIEAQLAALTGHVEAAERRSADAIDRMGREVIRIAQSMGARVQAVERRSAQAVEQVGGEMARLADAMEARMRSAEAAQAEALERLGEEIGRIADKLADRIAASERRSAAVIDDVGDQVVRVAEKLQHRYDHIADDLTDRIRQSEQRTARVLEEARGRLDLRAPDSLRGDAVEATLAARRAEVDLSPAPAYTPPETLPVSAFVPHDAADEEDAFAPPEEGEEAVLFAEPEPEPAEPEAAVVESAESFLFEVEAPKAAEADPFAFDPAPSAAADPFVEPFAVFEDKPAVEAVFEDAGDAASAFESAEPEPAARNVNRDLIDAARAAARQASGRRSGPAEAARGFSFGLPRKKKEAGPTLRTALLASGTAATLSMAVAGYGLLSASHSDEAAKPADPAVLAGAPAVVADASAPVATPPPADLAVAITPPPASAPAAAAPAPVPPVSSGATEQARDAYVAGVRQLEAGDPAGLDALRRAANLGDPQAQFYLSKLYETGGSGIRKDIVEARRWTERAAQGGEPRAMHNLGLYYFEGAGGLKSTSEAAAWFRRAADLGLRDSQYNLARLYEEGYGVARNLAEAYKWYLIAAADGDGDARAGADRVRQQIPAEVRTTAERAASGFRTQSAPAIRTAAQ